MLDRIKEITRQRLSGGKSESSGGQSSSSGSSGSGSSGSGSDKDVVVLTDDNFDDLVMKSKDMWLVEFYAPWCGHCKSLEPHWSKAATELKGKIKVGKLDATAHQKIAGKYGIRGYPTIKIFSPADKNKPEEYDGPRDSAGIVNIALEKLEKFGVIPDVEQLTNQNQFVDICQERTGVCIMSFLPQLYDSTAAQRKAYIDEIKAATKSSRGKPIYYLWAQGGDYFGFEEKLGMSFGYPAVVAINYGKKKYSVMRSAFSTDNLKTFVNSKFVA
jgi:protein disulfide-isomerase A6